MYLCGLIDFSIFCKAKSEVCVKFIQPRFVTKTEFGFIREVHLNNNEDPRFLQLEVHVSRYSNPAYLLFVNLHSVNKFKYFNLFSCFS